MIMKLTPRGVDLWSLALDGTAAIRFTKIQIGSGADAGRAATALSHVEKTLAIESIATGDIVVLLRAETFNNNDVTADWRLTEMGVLATDPDDPTAEILYAYGYEPPEKADIVPAHADRSLETTIKAQVYVGEAENVTAEILSGAYATREELAAHDQDAGAHKNLYVRAGLATGVTPGNYATAEGFQNSPTGFCAHAGGAGAQASAAMAFAHGEYAMASAAYAVAFGLITEASGIYSFAHGDHAKATSDNAVAFGCYTKADKKCEFVFGQYNDYGELGVNGGDCVEQVGWGNSARIKNIRTLDTDGNERLAGKLVLGAAPTADMDAATKKYVDEALATLRSDLGLT